MELIHIYKIAEKHFFAKQYNDVKLDNIANDLNIKKPSLYYYFENKRDFYTKTLKYSMKKYIVKLREVIEQNDLRAFIFRYLDYPSREKNLFAIASQQGYGDDDEINELINKGKQIIDTESSQFLQAFQLSPIHIYLVHQLLDKLAMENCIDGYCLDYSIEKLSNEIQALIKAIGNE